ncbi:MAG: hypothetical protein CMJ83_09625 [Planctomycetes bacterium]|nr:hypothetical protein [Planctomycetota bacterium]
MKDDDRAVPPVVSSPRKQRVGLERWCYGRSAVGRALFIAWAVYIGFQYFQDSGYVSLPYWLNFGIHEIGHVITRPFFPHFVYVAAGTIVQYAVPLGAIFMFLRQDDGFAAFPVCGVWIATNLYHTSWYISDARTNNIPSAPIFGEPTTSDWTYLLRELGILHWDRGIGSFLAVVAFLLMWSSIGLGGYMVWLTVRMGREAGPYRD